MASLVEHPLLSLFAIIALGYVFGSLKVKGLSLGTSGVLFSALLFGHLGAAVPVALTQLGILFFVFGVGIGAGPRFVQAFKSRGLQFAFVALVTIVVGGGMTMVVAGLFDLDAALSVGLFAGALTSTPGLAAALQALGDARVSVAYGVAYPFGVVGVVLFVQLLPKLLGLNLQEAAKAIEESNKKPPVVNDWFTVENKSIVGKRLYDVGTIRRLPVVVTRVVTAGATVPALDEVVLGHGDHLRAVGRAEDLALLEEVVGSRNEAFAEPSSDIDAKTVVVSVDEIAGTTIRQLGLRTGYGVTVTRLWRDDMEIVPGSEMTLELGDTLRLVGPRQAVEQVIQMLGRDQGRLDETPLLSVAACLFLGTALGLVPFRLSEQVVFKLGLAGGPLFVALLAGHLGRIGPLRFRVPAPARMFLKELGLVLFLAGAGAKAGGAMVAVLQANGLSLLVGGVLITTVPLLVGFVLATKVLKVDVPSSLGLMCGAMTSTPGLGATTDGAKSDIPALAYATVYPVALLVVTIAAQLLAMTLS